MSWARLSAELLEHREEIGQLRIGQPNQTGAPPGEAHKERPSTPPDDRIRPPANRRQQLQDAAAEIEEEWLFGNALDRER